MPGNEQTNDGLGTPAPGQVSRRSLLGAAGVGAAGLAAGAFGGLASASAATRKTAKQAPATHTGGGDAERPDSGEQVVVHVRSGRGGELDVYHGTSHTRVQDAALAARLRQMIR
jgi:hypothetical protein